MVVRKCPACGKSVKTTRPTPGRLCKNCAHSTRINGRVRKEPFSPRWFTRCKHNAAVRGHVFCVTEQDILELWEKQGRKCALSGLDIGWARVGRIHTISLDRIDNNRGYTLDNIQLVHKHVNFLKHTFPQVYFVNLCRMIAKHAVCR